MVGWKDMKKNRYASLYGALRYLADKKEYGKDNLGILVAKNKLKRKFKIKSFKDCSTKELKMLVIECHLIADLPSYERAIKKAKAGGLL